MSLMLDTNAWVETDDGEKWPLWSVDLHADGRPHPLNIMLTCRYAKADCPMFIPVELVKDQVKMGGKTNLSAFAAVARGQAIIRRRDGERYTKVASVGEKPNGRLLTAEHRVVFFEDEFNTEAMADDTVEGFFAED